MGDSEDSGACTAVPTGHSLVSVPTGQNVDNPQRQLGVGDHLIRPIAPTGRHSHRHPVLRTASLTPRWGDRSCEVVAYPRINPGVIDIASFQDGIRGLSTLRPFRTGCWSQQGCSLMAHAFGKTPHCPLPLKTQNFTPKKERKGSSLTATRKKGAVSLRPAKREQSHCDPQQVKSCRQRKVQNAVPPAQQEHYKDQSAKIRSQQAVSPAQEAQRRARRLMPPLRRSKRRWLRSKSRLRC